MSAAEKMSRRDEMETLLPFYLNGSLEGAELEAVEEWLASDPAAMAALGEAEAEFSGTAAGSPRWRAERLRTVARRRSRSGARAGRPVVARQDIRPFDRDACRRRLGSGSGSACTGRGAILPPAGRQG
jgi:anti-sigma factor RsiW